MEIRRRRLHVLVLLVLAVTLAAGLLSRGTAQPLPADAPEDRFSAERAASAAAPVVAAPRPIGSAANVGARAHLAAELEEAGFVVREEPGLAVRTFGTEGAAGFPQNLIASRPGQQPSGTIVLATHVDSVIGSPGAADAGAGIAVILETVRALGAEAHRNDLVILLVDGEEDGLLGAEALDLSAVADPDRPTAVLNLEARGTSGRPMISRTAGPLHAVVPAMPRPEAESFTDALFALVPHDTDFTVYREAGWWGMDMALVGGSWAYHSPQDSAANLDASSLQHYGDMVLALTEDLLDRDLGALDPQARPVMTTAPWGVVAVPAWAVRLAGVLLIAQAALLVQRGARRTEKGSLGRCLAAGLIGLLVLAVGIGAALGAWALWARLFPQMLSAVVGEPYRPGGLIAAEAVVAALCAGGGLLLLRRRCRGEEIAAGSAVVLGLLIGIPTLMAPALLGWAALPLALAALLRFLPVPARGLALAPVVWMAGAQADALAEFGMASSSGMLAATVLLVLLAAAVVLARGPAAEERLPLRRTGIVAAAGLVVVLGLAGTGIARSAAFPQGPQERVEAAVDATTGETTWTATGRTAWGRDLAAAEPVPAPARLPAPPRVAMSTAGERSRLVLTSARQSRTLELRARGGAMRELVIDGETVPASEGLTRLRIVGLAPGQSVVVEADLADVDGLELADQSEDLAIGGGWVEPPEDLSLVQSSLWLVVDVPIHVS
ncbi:M28 family peptidase [Brachybacterium hainanense]|uniref:M28 family peptidase n=1 Tax=Brachybacterium hainanense TaxID=1541174 RepID=A0ABV6RB42_9MICO